MSPRFAHAVMTLALVAACASEPPAGAPIDAGSLDTGPTPLADVGAGDDTGPADAGPEDTGAGDAASLDMADWADGADGEHTGDAPDTTGDAGPEDTGPLIFCDPPVPPPEALRKAGAGDTDHLLPGGRAITPVGTSAPVGGFPAEVRVHPTLPVAYVNNLGRKHKAIQVVDAVSGTLLQDLVREESFYGMALTPDGATLWVSGGRSSGVERYDVGEDGLLTPSGAVSVEGYPAGLALVDGALWVGQYTGKAVSRIDLATLTIDAVIPLPFGPYGVIAIPGRDELYVTGFADTRAAAVDLTTGEPTLFELGGNPMGLAVSADGSRVWASVCDGDIVVAIDTVTREVVGSAAVGEASLAGPDGLPLPASAPADLLLDEAASRLYVSRSSDNAVSILDPTTLATVAALPTEWYPTGLALTPDRSTLLVCNSKGVSVGRTDVIGGDADDNMAGTVSVVPLDGLDLAALTAAVEANVRRPGEVFPFDCPHTFPVPPVRGRKTPIKHVVLVVRENKTYDALLGDLETGDGDPELTLFGEGITPNLHALARRFTSHDNFYNESENSVQGHLWLTASYVNEYIERMRLEDGTAFATASATEAGQPDYGSFFLHLIRHDIPFINFGEVVGAFGETDGKTVAEFTDVNYPGLFYNQAIPDEVKVRYVVSRLVEKGDFPPFVFLSIPNDHTYGKKAGYLSPESMINDNDYATGLLVEAISQSPFWDSTAIFIVEDDPQQGLDHVEGHRSILVVASPWAKRAYTSSVHTSFPSLFRTFELILDLPPMNRYDANATPLWDAFTTVPDPEPYVALPRTVEDIKNPIGKNLATQWSNAMDFSGPDREPDLGPILWLHRKGSPPPGSHLAQAMAGQVPPVRRGPEDLDDVDAFDEGWVKARAWLLARPDLLAKVPPGTLPEALADLEAARPAAPPAPVDHSP
ncbi:MAG: hypothetical protein AMXMBFR64_31430 [Myxococcales bacterium]